MISRFAAKLSNGKQPLALPAPQADIRAQVRALAETLNAATWKAMTWSKMKAELLEIAK